MSKDAACGGSGEGAGETTRYTLRYFNWRGKAEVCRLLFALAGQPFHDLRLSHQDWPAYKPDTPFGQLPVLEINGEAHAQSVAIANFLAREFGLYGKCNREMVRVDEVVGLQQELMSLAVRLYYTQQPQAKDELARELRDEVYPRYCRHFQTLLEQAGTGYFVGTALTMADLAVYDILQGPLETNPSLLDAFPLVAENRRLVESNPRISVYLKSRPVTEC